MKLYINKVDFISFTIEDSSNLILFCNLVPVAQICFLKSMLSHVKHTLLETRLFKKSGVDS